ncbi:hypothetical protein KUA55_10295 [Enterococcus sp. ALS3]|uniref:PH domain-containing protein n=1 Tax=Enterococcus alishanensis TaxID=1303817 RepID=A0ABS6TDX8_9ENTE|nr:hypothetical protein [Enterococcus alishanensis]MBV7391072.1 hypothetical protein [Enterococcus alishanensis]
MKKITIWSWESVIVFSLSILFLLWWSIFSFHAGYSNSALYWLFFPSMIFVESFLLYKSFTVIEIHKTLLITYNIGNFKRRIFSIKNIELTYGNKVSGYRQLTYYPIVIYDKIKNKKYMIICGRDKLKQFDLLWKKKR